MLTTFDFQSSIITIPDLAIGERVTISRPFTFTGMVTGFRNGIGGTSHQLFGSGIVSISVFRSDPEFGADGTNVSLTRYEFQSEASPVPEPASMLLVGTGLAGLAAARRRRS